MPISSFTCSKTESLFKRNFVKKFVNIEQQARRKLKILNDAEELMDLRSPPGNNLEKLVGDLKDYYSIRINGQFRIIFKWKNGNSYDVEIIDYH